MLNLAWVDIATIAQTLPLTIDRIPQNLNRLKLLSWWQIAGARSGTFLCQLVFCPVVLGQDSTARNVRSSHRLQSCKWLQRSKALELLICSRVLWSWQNP